MSVKTKYLYHNQYCFNPISNISFNLSFSSFIYNVNPYFDPFTLHSFNTFNLKLIFFGVSTYFFVSSLLSLSWYIYLYSLELIGLLFGLISNIKSNNGKLSESLWRRIKYIIINTPDKQMLHIYEMGKTI